MGRIWPSWLLVRDMDRIFGSIDELNEAVTRHANPATNATRKVQGRRPVAPATERQRQPTLRTALNKRFGHG
jgi:hypothetical protein